MANDDDKADEIHKVDTVPPPPGEDDAYNAATKVGEGVTSLLVQEMIHATELKAAELSRRAAETAEASKIEAPPVKVETPSKAPTSLSPEGIPRVYDDEDDGEAATVLGKDAKRPMKPVERTEVMAARPPTPPPPPVEARPPRVPIPFETSGDEAAPAINPVTAIIAGLVVFVAGALLFLFSRC